MADISIVQVDTHGYLKLHHELFWGVGCEVRDPWWLSSHRSILNRIREERDTLLLDCRDTLHGTYHAMKIQGSAMLPVLNEMGFDAMKAHWEFAYGLKTSLNYQKSLIILFWL